MNRILYIVILLLLTGCKPTPKNPNESEISTIMVSIEPLRFLVEAIVGDTYKVVSLVPMGSSPETYEPTPNQMIDLEKSDFFFYVGNLGFERAWLERLKQMAPNVHFKETSIGIEQMGEHIHNEEHHHDPHVWTAPRNMQRMARNIYQALCVADSSCVDVYTKNLAYLLDRINVVNDSIRAITGDMVQKSFLIYHPTLTYFAHDYGFNQIVVEHEGKEPSPHQLIELIKLCRKENVKSIFIQQEFTQRSCQLIAQEIGGKVFFINPLSYDWEQEMIRVAHILRENE